MQTDTHLHSNEWLGGLFFHLLHLGKRGFRQEYAEEHLKRNRLAGYLIKICGTVLVFVLAHYFLV